MVFAIGFFAFEFAPSIISGSIPDLWTSGIFIYGAIVILANI